MPYNETYKELVINRQPFGWTFTDPDTVFNFSFEEADPFYWHEFIEGHWALAFYAGAVYIAAIYGIQWWMRDREAYQLKMPLFWWNLSLGIFSIIGFARMIPGFMYVLQQPDGFYTSICRKKDTNIPMGFWTLLFILSKYIELGDTVFIVLRKRPLIFLQWYHHLVTMGVTWVIAPHMEPVTRWYTVMNFFVHSGMYPYFALKAVGTKIPTLIANIITTLQLTQMIMGCIVNVLTLYYLRTEWGCERHPTSIKAFGVVYGSFLFLFGKLFYDSVIKAGRQKRDRVAKKVQ